MKIVIQQTYTHNVEVTAPDGLSRDDLIKWLMTKADDIVGEPDKHMEWDGTSCVTEDTDETICDW